MKPTVENRELVAAECLRLKAIDSYMSQASLKAYAGICLRHFAGPDALARAVTDVLEGCDRLPSPAYFVRIAAAEASAAPVRAYCRACQATGWEERLEMRNTLTGRREVPVCYRCRCCAAEGDVTAPPAEAQDEPFDPAYDGMSYRQQLIAAGCNAVVAMLDALPSAVDDCALSRLAAASQKARGTTIDTPIAAASESCA